MDEYKQQAETIRFYTCLEGWTAPTEAGIAYRDSKKKGWYDDNFPAYPDPPRKPPSLAEKYLLEKHTLGGGGYGWYADY
ncbi:hypothetical protein ACFL1G_05800 [Planctomycetota bacterium]